MKYITLLLLSVFLTCQATDRSTTTTRISTGSFGCSGVNVNYVRDESVGLCFAIFRTDGCSTLATVIVPCESIKNKLQ